MASGGLQLTSTAWPTLFHNKANDAIVSEVSQLDGLGSDFGYIFSGYAHSPGATNLGFLIPTVLDAGAVPTQVIFLLNKPWLSSTYSYYVLLNP
jgi:hypothetical protein